MNILSNSKYNHWENNVTCEWHLHIRLPLSLQYNKMSCPVTGYERPTTHTHQNSCLGTSLA